MKKMCIAIMLIGMLVLFSGGRTIGDPVDPMISFDGTDVKMEQQINISDFYDDTGMMLLLQNDLEGIDGTNLSSYDANWTITTDGSSVVEIDDAQAPGGGDTSALLYYDGVNTALAELAIPQMNSDMFRIVIHERTAQTNQRFYNRMMQAGSIIGRYNFHNDGTILIQYGNGAGGNNNVAVPYSSNTDYEIWCDFNNVDNLWRMWVDGILYPGPNSNAGGWDNLDMDTAMDYITKLYIFSSTATGSVWFDGIRGYTALENFSALSAPHDPDGITESVSPTDTDCGRQTWDGDWESTPVLNTNGYIIGSASINYTDLDNGTKKNYTFDTTQDFTDMTELRGYLNCSGSGDMNISLVDSLGNESDIIQVTLVVNHFIYFNESINWSDCDSTDVKKIQFKQITGGTENISIDGLHLYGDVNMGVCFQENGLNLNGFNITQDRAIYDIKQIEDTNSFDGNWTAEQQNATHNLDIEFSDVASSGIEPDYNGIISLDGHANGTITWTSVGDSVPTNYWGGDATGASILANNFRFSYMTYLGFGNFSLINGTISYAELYGIYGGNIDTNNVTIKSTIFANNIVSDIENATSVWWSLTNCTTDIVNVSTGAVMVMLNTSFDHSGFGVNSTGLLIETNWSVASASISGAVVTIEITNTTYSNWTPSHNIYNASGSQSIFWVYDWDDGNADNSTDEDKSHTYGESGDFTITLGSQDHLGNFNNTTIDVSVTVPVSTVDRIDALIPVVIAAMSVVIVMSILVNGIFKPFSRMGRRFPN